MALANTYTANSINPVNSRIFISAVAAFAEDSYKVTPTLTLEYGLRYEWNGTPAEGGHRFITFNPTTSAFQQVNQPYKQNNNYEPRLGFIYDVSGKGKTTVRGGFGYLVDQPIISAVTGLAIEPTVVKPSTDYSLPYRNRPFLSVLLSPVQARPVLLPVRSIRTSRTGISNPTT